MKSAQVLPVHVNVQASGAGGDQGEPGREDKPTGFALRGWGAAERSSRRSEKGALYGEIGRLKVELVWLRKKLACSDEDQQAWVEPEHARLSLRRLCKLLGSIGPACVTGRAITLAPKKRCAIVPVN